jgi:transposase
VSEEKKPTKKYLECVEPRLDEIKAWARDGVSEEEIAKRLGIAYSTFRDYRDKHSALSSALKKSKEHYDNEVVEALHKNTLGGVVVLKTPIKVKKTYFENGKKVREEEEIVIVEREEYVKPDTLAQMYWLNNRQPAKWKAKPVEDSCGEENTKANELRIVVEKKVVDLTKGEDDADN